MEAADGERYQVGGPTRHRPVDEPESFGAYADPKIRRFLDVAL
jgi:hypothetical protein